MQEAYQLLEFSRGPVETCVSPVSTCEYLSVTLPSARPAAI